MTHQFNFSFTEITIVFFCIIFNCAVTNAQEVILKGVVTDSIQNSLPNTNILAFPKTDIDKVRFTITNNKGEYQLALAKDTEYNIEVSYIGFSPSKFSFSARENTIKNIILINSATELDEVVLSYEIPVQIKKDTIIYNPDAFTRGNEKKLKEILKRLPGVEVDRKGNVTVKGKKVTKLLVDNEVFFTGDPKLATNNLPADAVDKIEVYENYSEIAFLKGLQDSDETALNIKLKEDKKKFVFGDIDGGIGVEDRYALHSNLFYYSPKTNINFIGDLNNNGVKSFSFIDFVQFEGGISSTPFNSRSNLFSSELSSFFIDQDFISNRNRFGAFNLKQDVTEKTKFNSYIIANSSDIGTFSESDNEFINNDFSTLENRDVESNIDNFFVIGKASLNYKPKFGEDLKINSFVKISNNERSGLLNSLTEGEESIFNTTNEFNSLEFKQNITYNKKLSKKHTVTSEGLFSFSRNEPGQNLLASEPFLIPTIPFQQDTFFSTFQEREVEKYNVNLFFKDFWVLNKTNHIYTSVGTDLVFENYSTLDGQQLSNEDNVLFNNPFGNNIEYRLFDTYVGVEYKFLLGIFTFKPGLVYHNFFFENKQLENQNELNTNVLLPELDIKIDISNIENISLKYKRNVQFPVSPQLSQNFIVSNFNSLLIGNPLLDNNRTHNFSLNYSKFNFIKGITIRSFSNYLITSRSIKNTSSLQGINQSNSFINLNRQENNISSVFNISKGLNDWKFTFRATGRYNDFFQVVNSNISKNISRSATFKGIVETKFDKLPNIELGYSFSPSNFRTSSSESNFLTNEIDANLEYNFLRDFTLKGDFIWVDFDNRSTNFSSTYNIFNASLFYQKEDSAWGFEINSTNIFNAEFKRQSSFSNFLITDQRTFILPRILLFKVSYKL